MALMTEVILWPVYQMCKYFILVCITISSWFRRKEECTPIQDELLLVPASVLVKRILRKEVSSYSVVKAYISRIKEVNPIINAVVEDRFDAALEDALAVDNMIANCSDLKDLEERYPLLGLPITIKESIRVKGISHAGGRVKAAGTKSTRDADVVEAVKSAGAIILLVSNTPELCLNWECDNKVTGITRNPYNSKLTSGGSSGGEAALLGSGGSLLGLGSDIAGSLRIPAHFCGVYGHKPTAWSVSLEGHTPDSENEEIWNDCFAIGPMTRYASDLPLLYKVIVKPEWKEMINLDEEVDFKTIKIYYLEHTGSLLNIKVDKEITQAMKTCLNQISESRETHVEQFPKLEAFRESFYRSIKMLVQIRIEDNIFNDDKKHNGILELLKYVTFLSDSTLTGVIYTIVSNLMQAIVSNETFKKYVEYNRGVRNILEEILGDNAVLVYPTYPTVAPLCGSTKSALWEVTYCMFFSTLGLPVTNSVVGYNRNGMPMGVQIIGSRKSDRLTMAVAKEMESVCGGWKPIPYNKTPKISKSDKNAYLDE